MVCEVVEITFLKYRRVGVTMAFLGTTLGYSKHVIRLSVPPPSTPRPRQVHCRSRGRPAVVSSQPCAAGTRAAGEPSKLAVDHHTQVAPMSLLAAD